LTPAEHAADLRRRAERATRLVDRNHLLWLAVEWEKAAERERLARPTMTACPPPYREAQG
jgi:hypothetical protein